MAILTLVPTPIGNLEDITLRALRVLKESELVLAEDTRTSSKLFKHHDIHTRMQSFHAHNEHKVLDALIEKIKILGKVALISDAGTPGISDPGFLLVRECLKHGIDVECLPGPTAFVPALVVSGFPCDRFIFEGFLPHKKGRSTRLKELAVSDKTIVFYESPHRLLKLLQEINACMEPQREVCIVREISKLHEEFLRGTAEELLHLCKDTPPKGEIVVIVQGKK
jgi:16S rRNA (cytidine1402-2'-O)-methyltransferase